AAGMFGFVGFSLGLFLVTTQGALDWKVFSSKAVAVFAFGLVAAWAARISEWHSREERRTRQFELDFSAFGPYSELLPDEEKVILRKEMAERFFRSLDESESLPKSKGSNAGVIEVAKLAMENLGEFIKKGT